MNTTSRPGFSFPSFPVVRRGRLAPFNVLDCEDFTDGASSPSPVFTGPAADSEELGGLLIALGVAVPAGIAVWALFITVYLALR